MALGVRPSPQTLSLPIGAFSKIATDAPPLAACMAVAAPAGPPPITMMSKSFTKSRVPVA